MLVLKILIGVVVVFILFMVVCTLLLSYYSMPYDEWVQLQCRKNKRKRGRVAKWKQLRKKYLSFWMNWRKEG